MARIANFGHIGYEGRAIFNPDHYRRINMDETNLLYHEALADFGDLDFDFARLPRMEYLRKEFSLGGAPLPLRLTLDNPISIDSCLPEAYCKRATGVYCWTSDEDKRYIRQGQGRRGWRKRLEIPNIIIRLAERYQDVVQVRAKIGVQPGVINPIRELHLVARIRETIVDPIDYLSCLARKIGEWAQLKE